MKLHLQHHRVVYAVRQTPWLVCPNLTATSLVDGKYTAQLGGYKLHSRGSMFTA
jgi:hypothetical protein